MQQEYIYIYIRECVFQNVAGCRRRMTNNIFPIQPVLGFERINVRWIDSKLWFRSKCIFLYGFGFSFLPWWKAIGDRVCDGRQKLATDVVYADSTSVNTRIHVYYYTKLSKNFIRSTGICNKRIKLYFRLVCIKSLIYVNYWPRRISLWNEISLIWINRYFQ